MSTARGQYQIRLPDGRDVWVELRFEGGHWLATAEGKTHRLTLHERKAGTPTIEIDGLGYGLFGDPNTTRLVGERTVTDVSPCLYPRIEAGGNGGTRPARNPGGDAEIVQSPLTGRVIALLAKPGAGVERGETLLVVEAMKMENRISAPMSGHVLELLVEAGATVRVGQPLVRLGGAT